MVSKIVQEPVLFAQLIVAIIALVVGLAVVEPWAAYLLLAGLYLTSIPFALVAYGRRKQRYFSVTD